VVQACVVDPEAQGLKPLAPGERGELLLKSPLIMSHYWNKPEKTAESIVTLPEEHGGHGWFRTGDVAKIDAEGYIHILDRVKDCELVDWLLGWLPESRLTFSLFGTGQRYTCY
jgi:long-subunit acyl-CoA synthetase (AMP-forming)